MRLSQIICEIRSNPELNPKVSINKIIRREYNDADELMPGVKNSFVSFTSIEKLGINPTSRYNTPLGIYCYPSLYVFKRTIKNGKDVAMGSLPFAGNEPNVNIFSVNGNMLLINKMSQDEYDRYLSSLRQLVRSKYKDSISIEEFDGFCEEARMKAQRYRHTGGRFWYIIMMVASTLGTNRGIKSSIMWNKLFREIGIDGVIDNGAGIIHPSEPTQGVFFRLGVVSNNKMVNNKYSDQHVQAGIKKGLDNKSNIADIQANISSLPIPDIIKKLKDFPSLMRFIPMNKRNSIISQDPDIIMGMVDITKDNITTAIESSKLAIFKSIIGATKPAISKLEYKEKYGEGFKDRFYKTYLEKRERYITTMHQVRKLLSETDIINFINNVTVSEYPNFIMESILKVFPAYDRLIPAILDKYPDSLYSLYTRRASPQVKQQIDKYYEAIGVRDPDSDVYHHYLIQYKRSKHK